jgi:hypothetical protein
MGTHTDSTVPSYRRRLRLSAFAWFLPCTLYSWYIGADTSPTMTISSGFAHSHKLDSPLSIGAPQSSSWSYHPASGRTPYITSVFGLRVGQEAPVDGPKTWSDTGTIASPRECSPGRNDKNPGGLVDLFCVHRLQLCLVPTG